MPYKSLDSYGSYMLTPDSYYNSGSGTLTLNTGHDPDAQNRISDYQAYGHYLTETQTTATNDLCDHFAIHLGGRFRCYLRVNGTGNVRMYNNGTALGSTVSFNTGGLWYLVDTGVIVQMDFGDYISPRVWGASSIDVGVLYAMHRPMVYDFTSVLVGSPPNTTTVTDAGSVAASVAQYLVGSYTLPYTPDKIASLIPGVNEGITPLLLGRIDNDVQAAGVDISNTEYVTAADKNGTQIGHHSITSIVSGESSNASVVTPSIRYLDEGGDSITPTHNGAATFTSTDTLNIYCGPSAGSASKGVLLDQLILSRDCAFVIFDGTNTTAASSFNYAWFDFGTATTDHYDIIVTDQGGGPAVLGGGNIQQTLSNVTSPTSVSGLSGTERVYLRAVLADGDWNCWAVDEFGVAAGQIIRYR